MTDADSGRITYTARYLDGPLEGRSEERALIGGTHEGSIPVIAAVEGLESTFWYRVVRVQDADGRLTVSYAFDPTDSDPVQGDGNVGDRP